MSDSAIPIGKTAVLNVIESIREVEANDPEREKEEAIVRLASTQGWQHLKTEIEAEVHRLKSQPVVNPEASLEAIGFRAIAIQLVTEKLQWVINRVEETYRASEQS